MKEKMNANPKEIKEDIKTNKAKAEANQEEMIAKMDAWLTEMRAWRKETTACQEATEACLKRMEPTSLELESESEHREVLKEDVAVKTVGALKKRYRDWHLEVGLRGQPKKWAQGNGGSRKMLAAFCRRMNRRAGTARRKGRGHKVPTEKSDQEQCCTRNPEGTDVREETREQPEGGNGIRGRDLKEQLRLGSERISCRFFRKVLVLEIMKPRVEPSVRIRKMSVRISWKGRPPPKGKKRPLSAD
jgi:hypothetical protein